MVMAPARLQRMLFRLQKYDVNLVYKQGKLIQVAYTFSRAQLAETAEEISEEEMRSQVHLIHSSLPCSNEILEEVHQETSRSSLHKGWLLSKKALPDDLKEYCKESLAESS